MPFFDLPKGAALAFLFLGDKAGSASPELHPLELGDGVHLTHKVTWSWRGFRVLSSGNNEFHDVVYKPKLRSPCLIWLDLTSGAEVQVNRETVYVNDATARELFEFVSQRLTDINEAFLSEHRDSLYASLNSRLSNCPTPGEAKLTWATFGQRQERHWREVEFPCIFPYHDRNGPSIGQGGSMNFQRIPLPDAVFLNGRPVDMCDSITLLTGDGSISVSLMGFDVQPDRVIQGLGNELFMMAVWDQRLWKTDQPPAGIAVLIFPPQLECGACVPPTDFCRESQGVLEPSS
jgi:hypothetical protein